MTVDLAAIQENWRFFKRAAPNAATAAVVKAEAYGLGAARAATALAQAGARVFFTATLGEALNARQALGDGPQILVLNGPSEQDVALFAPARIAPVLNSLAQIKLWAGRGPAALHIDTGMNRLGIGPEELAQAASLLKGSSLVSVMSHLACGGDLGHAFNETQRMRFVDAASLFPNAPLSLSATAGALMGPNFHFDLIRPGIGLYGSGGLDAGNPTLAAAAKIEAPILQVRDAAAGETFGYGASFTAPKPMRAATVAIGYADGFLRALGGRGYGFFAGAKRPILGRISMDLTIVDVTGCAEAQPGAMVEFLGPNAPLEEVAQLAGTAPYEILTTFAGAVRRGGVA
ncbi:MAG TPA: alanine racemase [Terricaulis sp.]|nr:alanine racemase [Terricaulis sp.]